MGLGLVPKGLRSCATSLVNDGPNEKVTDDFATARRKAARLNRIGRARLCDGIRVQNSDSEILGNEGRRLTEEPERQYKVGCSDQRHEVRDGLEVRRRKRPRSKRYVRNAGVDEECR